MTLSLRGVGKVDGIARVQLPALCAAIIPANKMGRAEKRTSKVSLFILFPHVNNNGPRRGSCPSLLETAGSRAKMLDLGGLILTDYSDPPFERLGFCLSTFPKARRAISRFNERLYVLHRVRHRRRSFRRPAPGPGARQPLHHGRSRGEPQREDQRHAMDASIPPRPGASPLHRRRFAGLALGLFLREDPGCCLRLVQTVSTGRLGRLSPFPRLL